MKLAEYAGKTVNAMPEYEDVRAAALANGVAFREVHAEVLNVLESRAGAAASK